MTMVCCDTPMPRRDERRPAALALDELASRLADRLAMGLKTLARDAAEHRRNRLDRAALEAMPFDLRKDLGWPAGDIRR